MATNAKFQLNISKITPLNPKNRMEPWGVNSSTVPCPGHCKGQGHIIFNVFNLFVR